MSKQIIQEIISPDGASRVFRLTLYVKPNARTQKIEIEEDYFVVFISSPPDKGKANKEIIKLLSDRLKISSSYVSIVSGQKSRDKIAEINCKDGMAFTIDKIRDMLKEK